MSIFSIILHPGYSFKSGGKSLFNEFNSLTEISYLLACLLGFYWFSGMHSRIHCWRIWWTSAEIFSVSWCDALWIIQLTLLKIKLPSCCLIYSLWIYAIKRIVILFICFPRNPKIKRTGTMIGEYFFSCPNQIFWLS